MIEEEGVVAETADGRALVETQRSGSCQQCAARGACAHLGGGREARVWVEDPIGVQPGDRVVLAVAEATVVRASLLIYLLPVVALFAGALLGNHLAPSFGVSPDLGAAGLGIVAMALAFLVARSLGGKTAPGPRIVRKA